ncbi:MAG: hypothetical protein H6835_09435 [Planctomycetes bacterium]|nr:hypothetical protein [Planctomycetota bacterium]
MACLAALALAACSGPASDATAPRVPSLPLVAHGTAPFWWLRIDQESVAFGTLGDAATFVADVAPPLSPEGGGGWRCLAGDGERRLEATLVPRVDSDPGTGMPYPFTVTVRLDDAEWRGVGGDPGQLLRGFPWVVLQAGAMQPLANLRPTLEFRPGGVLVFAAADGCTTGTWKVDGGVLQLTGFGSLMAPFRDALASARAFSITAGGELVLKCEGVVVLRATRGHG